MSQDDEKLRARIMDAILELPRDQLLRLANIIAEENGERQLRPIAIQGIDEHAIPSQSDQSQSRDWPHAPVHRLSDHGTYLVTAGTLYKQHFFRSSERLDFLEGKLLQLARQYFWQLEAWAVFPNHYHFIAHSQPGSEPLNGFLRDLHAATALYLNRLEMMPGRQVWHNFWETKLTFERSYLARLNYVHNNPVKHGLVPVANQYRWCSAAWFERTATPAQVKTIYSFKTDQLRVLDDFEVLPP